MFFDNLYKACKQKNTTPNGMAKILNISSGSITSWKNGVVPNSDKLKRIAEYLEVSTDYLLGNEKKNKPLPQLSDKDLKLFNDIKALSPEQQEVLRILVESYKNK